LNVGVVDIGTNSMRLLITDGNTELGRWVEVTGLGQGVDATGLLSRAGIERTLSVFRGFGDEMDRALVGRRMAMATSACRDAVNTDSFFDKCEPILGVRPDLVSGGAEARFAYRGAISGQVFVDPVVVSDIGGGSSEFVSASTEVSIDIGSVRLTESVLPNRPASVEEMGVAHRRVEGMFDNVDMGEVGTHVGVAGTWTSLAAMVQELAEYDGKLVHGYRLSRPRLEEMTLMLAAMSVEETAAIPSLDPKRAPVILAGAVVAVGVMDSLDVVDVLVSERDSLDGAAEHLLALP
jgi:exopolyphosphatase/guanosine-5'-triphosphate,3'-diphosphate pyrophosphatase